MTNRNVKGNGKFADGPVLEEPTRQTEAAALEPGRTRCETLRTNAMIQPDKGKRLRLDWQMIALWIFVGFSFAALILTGYLIWAKCRNELPF